MVQEPRAIIECAIERSLFSSRLRYRSISCSVWYMLKIGCWRISPRRANCEPSATAGLTEGARPAAEKGTGAPMARMEKSWSTSSMVVVSSIEMATRSASILRRLQPCLAALAITASARPAPTFRVTVSKNGAEGTPWPSRRAPSARTDARPWTRAEMRLRPSGPW